MTVKVDESYYRFKNNRSIYIAYSELEYHFYAIMLYFHNEILLVPFDARNTISETTGLKKPLISNIALI